MKISIILLFIYITLSQTNCPSQLEEDGVPSNDTKTIVSKHNHLRSLIMQGQVSGQPKGVNLKTMKWDKDLAQKAQNISRTCNFQHVKVNDTRWFWVGQNLALSWSTQLRQGAEWNDRIQDWFDENKLYKYPSNPDDNTGHYTQVVWADSQYIGCGYTAYFQNGNHSKFYVCNYGPGGNILGQAPYKKAE